MFYNWIQWFSISEGKNDICQNNSTSRSDLEKKLVSGFFYKLRKDYDPLHLQ